MIRTREDLRRYMEADKEMLEREGARPSPVDYVWRFERLLRRSEYWHNRPKTPVSVLWGKLLSLRLARMEARLGFPFPSTSSVVDSVSRTSGRSSSAPMRTSAGAAGSTWA